MYELCMRLLLILYLLFHMIRNVGVVVRWLQTIAIIRSYLLTHDKAWVRIHLLATFEARLCVSVDASRRVDLSVLVTAI